LAVRSLALADKKRDSGDMKRFSSGGAAMKKVNLVFYPLLVFGLLALVGWYRQPLMDLMGIISNQDAISEYLQSYGPVGPIMLFILLVAQVFLGFIPGYALMVAAGYVYGLEGLCLVLASTILSSQVAFLLTRKYGRGWIYRIASSKVIEYWEKTARHQGILFFFFSFVLPIFPGDMMCYVAGLATISSRRFLVANILGRTCCAVFVTLIGLYGMKPPMIFWIITAIGISVFSLGWVIYKRGLLCASHISPNPTHL